MGLGQRVPANLIDGEPEMTTACLLGQMQAVHA